MSFTHRKLKQISTESKKKLSNQKVSIDFKKIKKIISSTLAILMLTQSTFGQVSFAMDEVIQAVNQEPVIEQQTHKQT